ncbi:MAG: hypothetical protein P4L10_13090 [Acidobacteriaceae bacterium]|nr:hypothetical protein [Acidobacteriaceae bacterium]
MPQPLFQMMPSPYPGYMPMPMPMPGTMPGGMPAGMPPGAIPGGLPGQMPMGMMPQGMSPQQFMQPPMMAPQAPAPQQLGNEKEELGEQLYPKIEEMIVHEYPDAPENSPSKITGMLLELNRDEILGLLSDPEKLHAKLSEAIDLLKSQTPQ